MLKSIKLSVLAIPFLTLSNLPVVAANCDPNAILRSNVSQYNENIAVWISYVKNLQSTTDSKNSSDIGISYAGFGLDYSDASSLYQYISDHENYSLSATDSVSVLRSTLDPNSVNAYLGCLHSNNPITLYIDPTATSSNSFPIKIHWNPDYPAKDNQTLTVTVINGKIGGKSKATTVLKNKSDEAGFTLDRDNNGKDRLYVTASIFGKVSDPATIPPIPRFHLTLAPKFSPPIDQPAIFICRSGHCGTPYVKVDQCVYPDAGSILVPSTLKFIAEKLVGDPRRSTFGLEPGADQFHACGFIASSAGGDTDYNYISGRFLTAQTVLTPIDPTSPAASPVQPKQTSMMENWDKLVEQASKKSE
ncbi:hypothetical protein ACVWXO_008390 [Bradyrhizobium sp. LM2.7]